MSDELETFFGQIGSEADESQVTNHAPTAMQAAGNILDGSKALLEHHAASAWAVSGNMYWGISHSLPSVPPGCYKCGQAPSVGVFLVQQPLKTDTLLRLPDSKSERVIQEIEQFQQLRPDFVQRGFLYKRGILLWGPPGSGKTSTLHLLMDLIVTRCQGVALIVSNPHLAGDALQLIRRIEPERQIVAIMEDLDGLIHEHSVEGFLSLLDGEDQIDNVIFVATTNYPERLDRRFVDRPSRFDTVEYVGMPTAEARRLYLTTKDPSIPPETIEEMVRVSEGFSIAHLREFIIATQCFKRPVQDAATRLLYSQRRKLSSEKSPDALPAGFASGSDVRPVINQVR